MARRPIEIQREEMTMATLVQLTNVFEGIASMRIAEIKNQVLQATRFFNELWSIYTQLRVGVDFGFGRTNAETDVIPKELFIIITAEGGFSGDIDHKLIELLLQSYDPMKNDIIVIGHHGAIQLAQRGVQYKKYFKLPSKDKNINVAPLIREVQLYSSTTVFYQQYVSLMVQDVKRIALSNAVQQKGQTSENPDEIISEANYIFEPTSFDVVDHLEQSMMSIALSQLILDSKLAQYASRFRAMSASNNRATDAKNELHRTYNHARRALKDERLKETITAMKKIREKAAL